MIPLHGTAKASAQIQARRWRVKNLAEISSARLRGRSSRRTALVLFAGSLILNSIGIGWGQPGGVPWDFDSIAGVSSFKEGDHIFGEWRHKYPRTQFIVNNILYRPLLKYWYGELHRVPRSELRIMRDPVHAERFGVLIVISQMISALLGAGAVVGLFYTALRLFGDALGAVLSGVALATTQTFVFYNHLGNLDGPAAFWFAWSLFAAAGVLHEGKRGDFALLGLFVALTVCTKDATGGYIPGVLAALGVTALRTERARKTRFFRDGKVGLLVFLFAFVILNDVVLHPGSFSRRMAHWIGGPGVTEGNMGFSTQGTLLLEVLTHLYLSMGWPLLLAAGASVAYCWVAGRTAFYFATLPLISFYLAVIVNIKFSAPRYWIPAFVCLALPIGKFLADLLRSCTVLRPLRLGLVTSVVVLSLLYCVALDLDLVSDTRYQAEAWFRENVPSGSRVAALCPWTLAPRLQLMGYEYDWRWGRPTNESVLGREPAYPTYLILSEKYYTNQFLFDQGFLESLMEGRMGYTVVVSFTNRYLYPRRSLLGVAGWPLRKMNQVSPEIHVLKRNEEARTHPIESPSPSPSSCAESGPRMQATTLH